jgi:hypothetical protein
MHAAYGVVDTRGGRMIDRHRHPHRRVAQAAAAVLVALAPAACASTGTDASTTPSTSVTAPGTAPTAVISPTAGTEVAIGGGSVLPDSWPAELPAYPEGQIMSAVVAEGGKAINAAWSSERSGEEAFAAMEGALLAEGYVTSKDAGRPDMLITAEGMTSQDYVGDAYEVNVTVSWDADFTTVMLNASRL